MMGHLSGNTGRIILITDAAHIFNIGFLQTLCLIKQSSI